MLKEGHIGVHPPGALGVAFFTHMNADCFIGRTDDGITRSLKEAGSLTLDEKGIQRSVGLKDKVFTNLLEADARSAIPELLLVCCNPDQLEAFTAEMTRFIENLAQRGRLRTVDDITQNTPILLILPNGILAQQTTDVYTEQLTQAALLDRLPGVDEQMIDALINRLVRGISLQAGGRRGAGPKAVYILEPRGSIEFAGGGQAEQDRVAKLLTDRQYPFRHVRDVPPKRIEFDKAMISIVLNVGGLIHAVAPDGELCDLRMGDLCSDPQHATFVQEATKAVFDVGQAAGAYSRVDHYEDVWAEHRATILRFAGHVTSSLKTFRDALAHGLDSVHLLSNEEWILSGLSYYASKAGLTREEELFTSLRRQIQRSMANAIRRRRDDTSPNGSGARKMKLSAQRNIGIELYQAADDDLVLIGTMLDNDHLIKLEMTIHVPDEQITRSELDMIRSPFPVCREVESTAERLVGLRIERGVLQEINRRIGGRAGCSHIKELATNIIYFVASFLARRRAGADPFSPDYDRMPSEEQFRLTRGLLRDSCLAYCQTTPAGLDERIGIRRLGDQNDCPIELGDFEPSLGAILRDRADKWPDKIYLRYRLKDEIRSLTWHQFADQVFRIASNLIALNIRPGDRIAMLSENSAQMYMFELAAMSIGAVTVPIFAGHHAPQVEYVLRHSRPRFVIVSGTHQLTKIDSDQHTTVESYYCIDFDAEAERWGAIPFAALTESGGASIETVNVRMSAVKPQDLCMVMYTSGTTGAPKGVRLRHGNLISQQKAMSLLWDVSENDVFMSYLPWHHSFGGLFERLMSLYNGCELCLDDSRGRDLERLIQNWREFNPSLFFSVPRVHDLLVSRCLDEPETAQMVLKGRLRFVFTAAAPLPAHVEEAYRRHDIPVLEGWGLTETSPCCTVRTQEHAWRSGYVGFPIPGVSVRIDADQEILVKGPNVMEGYLDDEESTAHVIDENGWFHTGDLGEFTKDGLRIFGRKDGAFKLTTGEIVHPQRLEVTLVNESPLIGTALVAGSGKNFVGALIYPDFHRLEQWAKEHEINSDHLTDDPRVLDLFAAEIDRINPMIELKYQRLRRIVLADREPSFEAGELTPSAKLVRKKVLDTFNREFEELFSSEPPQTVIQIEQQQVQGA